ncbi:ATP-binding protein [Micromonospora sp. CPCC 206061]|uniref:ATP-binding protein n=1 Tax=Micromonospora sp. CPCC 206061 TaxID=3122410 RepID=UPI002FF1781F
MARHGELSLLQQAWEAARRGEARIVGVAGVAGIGKTALVRRFVETTRPTTLLWVSGDEAETDLSWGVVEQVARGLHEPLAAFGDAAQAHADPAGVGQALASHLRRATDLILVVDDAQWCDAPSMTALRVAVRRLTTDAVLVVVACRTSTRMAGSDILDDGWRRMLDSDRGASIVLGGLPAADLHRLAVSCGHPGLPPAGAARLHDHTGGHPSYVRQILDRVPMRSIVYGLGPLPAPATIARPMAARLASCRPSTRELVVAGAVVGARFSLAKVRDLLDGTDVAGSATEAIDAGLVEEVPGTAGQDLAFTSPLARSVAYHEAGRARRQELHRRAAVNGQGEALWHRIAAADGPDDRLAHDLEQAARAHQARGELAPAAMHLHHALELTPSVPRRTPRLLAAVEAMLVVGDVATAMERQGELAAVEPGPWSDYVAGYQLLLAGRLPEARERLDRALAMVRTDQPPAESQPPDLLARICTQLALIGILTLSYDEMVQHGATAAATAREPWVASFASFMRAIGLAVAGRGAEALAYLADADMPGAVSGLNGTVARGVIRLWTDDLAGAHSDLTSALTRAIRGEPLRIAQALGFLGEVEYRRGQLDEAVLHTSVAIGDSEVNNRVWDYPLLHAQASYPLAAQGEWQQAQWHAEQASTWARRSGVPADLAHAAASQAAVAQAKDDPDRLLAAAERMEQVYPAREPGTHLAGPVRADALSQLGRATQARQALDAFLARLPTIDRASVRMSVARVRAQIAAAEGDHAEAIAHCAEAAGHAHAVGLALEAARIDLLTGTCHSTMGRRAVAERCLRSALDQFARIGAMAYVNQTMRAADRAGLRLGPPAAPLAALTTAERAVAALACQGLSNRRIAERLVVSVKTVEFHLTNAFRRLDVSTRAELRRVVTGAS